MLLNETLMLDDERGVAESPSGANGLADELGPLLSLPHAPSRTRPVATATRRSECERRVMRIPGEKAENGGGTANTGKKR